MTKYTERATAKTRLHQGRRQRLHDKVGPEQLMIIDGVRRVTQKIVGGVWRDEHDATAGTRANYPLCKCSECVATNQGTDGS